MRTLAIVALTATGFFGVVAKAAPVSISEPSFENPVAADNTYGGGPGGPPGDAITGWTSGGGNGVQNFPGVGLPGTVGENTIYINGANGFVYQDVGALLPNTTYTLTVAAGNQAGYGANGSTGRISLVNGTNASGTELSGTDLGDAALPVDSLTDFTASFTTGGSVTGDLTIALRKTAGDQVLYDNVRLDATAVPEPTGIAVLGLTAAGALARRRREG